MKTKLILVNMVGWRCGSSMLVGLLEQLGASIGECDRTIKDDGSNPLGYFENTKILDFYKRIFPKHWYPCEQLLNYDDMVTTAQKHQDEFDSLCYEQFNGSNFAAVKSMMCCLQPFVENSSVVDWSCVWLRRDLESEAGSLNYFCPGRRDEFYSWLKNATEWTADVLKSVNHTEVYFEDLLKNSSDAMTDVCKHVGIKHDIDIIERWINPEFSKFSKIKEGNV